MKTEKYSYNGTKLEKVLHTDIHLGFCEGCFLLEESNRKCKVVETRMQDGYDCNSGGNHIFVRKLSWLRKLINKFK